MKDKINFNSKLKNSFSIYTKLIILIILIIICVITSFRTGQIFYNLANTNLENTNSSHNTEIAKWNFKVTIVYKD